jgi:EAL domain-containing protein (putative c-di-GMP-specific phosphodiesterase class I)
MATDPVDASMVAMINQIGHVMGLKTIAEYVESDALRQLLVAQGIDYGQGFALHRPSPMGLSGVLAATQE